MALSDNEALFMNELADLCNKHEVVLQPFTKGDGYINYLLRDFKEYDYSVAVRAGALKDEDGIFTLYTVLLENT